MKQILNTIVLLLLLALGYGAHCLPQSLAEIARLEAERRQKIEQQGVPSKRILTADLGPMAPAGTVSISSPVSRPAASPGGMAKADPRPALRTFQSRLQKLDREIAQSEENLKLLRARADAERWAPVKTTKGSRGSGASSSQEQLHWQVLALEGKLPVLRRERSDVFQAGRKAGYLPGELENRGIVR